jgi:pimeloyl-ACP methyl ester carboxylesterase
MLQKPMSRMLGVILALVVLLVIAALMPKPGAPKPYDETVCAGPPLRTVQEREEAHEAGYVINGRYGCIDKASFEQVKQQQLAWDRQHAEQLANERKVMIETGAPSFAQARHGFETRIGGPNPDPQPLPQPPAELFVRSDYRNAQNHTLAGFVSPDPHDGERHPAIVWLTGGDSSSLGDFWTPGAPENDQSAQAFRAAGVIMLFPTLRGGNDDRTPKQYFLGEVEDVIAAAEQLAQLSYVDPERIYLGGHSTGGTLALLTAAMKSRFRAVFAFGPVATVDSYAPDLIPVDFSQFDAMELRLRSPLHWLADIAQPTYVIEGVDSPSNIDAVDVLCAASRNPLVHCIHVAGHDHFSTLDPVNALLAARIAVNPKDKPVTLSAEDLTR